MATCPSCRKRYPDDVTKCEVDGETLLHDRAFVGEEKDLVAGQPIGEYVVEAKIGEGGFGSVYRAVHPLIGKTAAIKVLNRQYSSNPQWVSRFIAEARAVNQIKNRYIIDIFAFGSLDDGRQYYVMELLEGLSMDAFLKQRGRLTPEDAIPLLRGIAKALDAAHAAGIAHRDLKPENVFLVIDEDGTPSPKLLDFGIAKLLGESAAQHKTRTGTPMGTPAYMSPEQCRGKSVDHRTDLYSLGVLAHEALTGKLPFDGDDVMEILLKQTTADAPPMSTTCPAIPPSLDRPVLELLDKDPAKRPQSAILAIEEIAKAAKAAGFAVSLPNRSGGGHPSGPRGVTPSSMTPAQLGDLVSARTVAQVTSGKTLMAAESGAQPAAPSRTLLYVVALIGCLGGVGIVLALARGGNARAGIEPVTVQSASAVGAAPPVSASAAPSAVPVAPPTSVAPPQEPTEVELAIEANAPHVDVFDGSTKLGSGPGTIKVPRSEAPLKLTFKAAGFKPAELTVSALKSDVVKVDLAKAIAAPGAPKKGNKDLEF
jgi:serine/threonine-protein kinase